MLARIFVNSLVSFNKGSNRFSGMSSEAIINLNKHLVSPASRRFATNQQLKVKIQNIAVFLTFDFCFLTDPQGLAALDYSTFAPIEVPERISCLAKSLPTPGVCFKKLHRLTMRTENSKVLSQISKVLSGIILLTTIIFHPNFLTFDF